MAHIPSGGALRPQQLTRVFLNVLAETTGAGGTGARYIRVELKDVKGIEGIQFFGAFWVDWKAGPHVTVEGAVATQGGAIRGFEQTGGGSATALVVLTGGEEFEYRLCVSYKGGSSRLAHGGKPTDGGKTLECIQVGFTDPNPPPKVIVPPPFVGTDRAESQQGVTVRITEMTWADGTPYLQASAPARPKKKQVETVRFVLPKGYSFAGMTNQSGGATQPGSGRPVGSRQYQVDVSFDSGNEFQYDLTLTDSQGKAWAVFGGRPCTPPDRQAGQGPNPPPVIIGDP